MIESFLNSQVARRVAPIAVTGLGALCAAGNVAAMWQGALAGSSSAAWFQVPNAADGLTLAACTVKEIPTPNTGAKRTSRTDRCVQLALQAALDAVQDAGLDRQPIAPQELGVFVGTSRGPIGKLIEQFEASRGGGRVSSSSSTYTTIDCLSGVLAKSLGAQGPSMTVAATCASGAHAIALGAQHIALGGARCVVAGGAEAPLVDPIVRQLIAAGVVGTHDDPSRTCRPFDATRNGTVLGEGAAFLVLESMESAQQRGAMVLAQLAGWGLATDDDTSAAPSLAGEGLVRSIHRALRVAGLSPDDVDCVNVHGTGTQLNDAVESLALRSVFGERAGQIPCSATKPLTGHCLGATPALEAVLSILSLQRQCVPPTANCEQPDPACSIQLIRGSARPASIRCVLSTSLGFWGKNAALLFTAPGQ